MGELVSLFHRLDRYFKHYSAWNIQRGQAAVAVKARDIGEAQELALPLLRRMEALASENQPLSITYCGAVIVKKTK